MSAPLMYQKPLYRPNNFLDWPNLLNYKQLKVSKMFSTESPNSFRILSPGAEASNDGSEPTRTSSPCSFRAF